MRAAMQSELVRRNKDARHLDVGTLVEGGAVLIMFGIKTDCVELSPKNARAIARRLLRQADEAERIPRCGVEPAL